jgi:hypothetical protein
MRGLFSAEHATLAFTSFASSIPDADVGQGSAAGVPFGGGFGL